MKYILGIARITQEEQRQRCTRAFNWFLIFSEQEQQMNNVCAQYTIYNYRNCHWVPANIKKLFLCC